MFSEFIDQYGTTLLYTALTALAGYLGMLAKKYLTRWLNTKAKKEIARECVRFAEQAYKDLHGKDKLNAAMTAATQMLSERGIAVTDLELRVLLESALAQFNRAFEGDEA